MTQHVLVEVCADHIADPEWLPVNRLGASDPLATMATNDRAGRQVLAFGWDNDIPGVWLTAPGTAVDLKRLAYLGDGPFERLMVLDGGDTVRVRWSLTP